jgi:hypothetical protein
MVDAQLLLPKKDREDYEAYLQKDRSSLKDMAYFLSKLHVKEIDKTLNISVPDCVVFFRTEPIMKLTCPLPNLATVLIDKDRENLQPLEIDRFFKACNDKEIENNKEIEESISKRGKVDESINKNLPKEEGNVKYYPRIVRPYYLDGPRKGTA